MAPPSATCSLRSSIPPNCTAKNPFDYLTEVLRQSVLVAAQRGDWMPWTYKATLARLSSR
jgi:hypothetical protein